MAKKKIFYGWYVVAACFVLLTGSVGIGWNCLAQFIKPICDDLGYSRPAVAAILTILYGVFLVLCIAAGRIFSVFRQASLMKVGVFLLPLCWVAFSFASSLIWLYVCTAVTTFAIFTIGNVPCSIILNNWFVDKIGFVTGLTFMGGGIGGMLFNSLTGVLLTHFGWRNTFLILAAVIFVIVYPCVFFIIRVDPREMGLTPFGAAAPTADGASADAPTDGYTFAQVSKMPFFWVICGSIILFGIPGNTILQTISPHLTDIGFDLTFAANMTALCMGAMAAGNLALGVINDKFGIKIATLSSTLATALGLLGLYLAKNPVFLVLTAFGTALGSSFGSVSTPVITRTLFGSRDFSSIYGFINACSSCGGMLAPIICNAIFEAAGSYDPAFLVTIGISLAVTAVFALSLKKAK